MTTRASCFGSHVGCLPKRVYLPKRNLPTLGGYEVTVIMGKKDMLNVKIVEVSFSLCSESRPIFFFFLHPFLLRLPSCHLAPPKFLGPFLLFCSYLNSPPCFLSKSSLKPPQYLRTVPWRIACASFCSTKTPSHPYNCTYRGCSQKKPTALLWPPRNTDAELLRVAVEMLSERNVAHRNQTRWGEQRGLLRVISWCFVCLFPEQGK